MRSFPCLALILLVAGCGGGAGQTDGDPLADTAWVLEQLDGKAAATGIEVTARFAEGRIGGKAGCNQYFASYTVDGDSLRIGPAGATKMMCPEPAMAVEDAFLAALQDIRTFKASGGRLQLHGSGGAALTFTTAPFTAGKE